MAVYRDQSVAGVCAADVSSCQPKENACVARAYKL